MVTVINDRSSSKVPWSKPVYRKLMALTVPSGNCRRDDCPPLTSPPSHLISRPSRRLVLPHILSLTSPHTSHNVPNTTLHLTSSPSHCYFSSHSPHPHAPRTSNTACHTPATHPLPPTSPSHTTLPFTHPPPTNTKFPAAHTPSRPHS